MTPLNIAPEVASALAEGRPVVADGKIVSFDLKTALESQARGVARLRH